MISIDGRSEGGGEGVKIKGYIPVNEPTTEIYITDNIYRQPAFIVAVLATEERERLADLIVVKLLAAMKEERGRERD